MPGPSVPGGFRARRGDRRAQDDNSYRYGAPSTLPGFAALEMFSGPGRHRRGLYFSDGIPVSDIHERRTGDLLIRIDRDLCVGFGDCIEAAEAAFELDDEGIAAFKEDIDEVDRETLLAACDECPVDAISVLDSDGTQLVP